MADAEQKKITAEKVCVTGAAGYVGSSLVKRLLDRGYVVHATVRDPGDKAKVEHLQNLDGAKQKLRIFKADLCDKGSFDAAIAGCRGVFHVATPTRFDGEDPENETIKPAVEGTLDVLESCRKAGTVKRVVVTSSAAAQMVNETRDHETEHIDESCWSDVNSLRTQRPYAWAYAVSKTEAERVALQYGEAKGLQVLSLLPVVVVGPWLTRTVPGSVTIAMSALTGQERAFQHLRLIQSSSGSVALVHVDDLCDAHVFLYELPSASGRHVCCSMCVPLVQLVEHLRQRYPSVYAGPTEFDDVDIPRRLRMSSKKLLDMGFSFRHADLDSMLDDTVEQLNAELHLNHKPKD